MDNCIYGNHLEYGDIFIEKQPEGIKFCLKCSDKNTDTNHYLEGKGRLVGCYGKGYYNMTEDSYELIECNNVKEFLELK